MVLNPIITKAEAIKLEQVLKALNIVVFSMSGAVTFHNKIMKNVGMCSYTNLKDAQSRKNVFFSAGCCNVSSIILFPSTQYSECSKINYRTFTKPSET